MSKLEHQRSRRFAKVSTDPDDGMTVLYGRFDPVTGARITSVLSHKMDQPWRDEDPRNRATPGQRMADALEALLTRPGQDDDGRSQGTRLLLIAEYDAITRELGKARLADGTPIPAHKIRQMACDAEVLPAIFRGASQPLDLGRARRIVSPTQRIALVARDRKCIGCGASASWRQAHHIIPWQPGGPPTSTTCVCYAVDVITRCTTTAGEYAEPPPDSTPSDHPPPTTDAHPTHETQTAAAPSKEHEGLASKATRQTGAVVRCTA